MGKTGIKCGGENDIILNSIADMGYEYFVNCHPVCPNCRLN